MRPTTWLCALLLAPPLAAQDIAITNVNVIAMDDDVVKSDYVVLIRNGIITAVEPRARARIPANTQRIDGHGGYLVPGLADMHVHIQQRSDLDAYLAYGVTTVANMGSPDSRILRLRRDSIRAGQMLGPELFVGYFMDGPGRMGGVATTDSARIAVARADSLGYDFIKAYNSLTAEQFDAIMSEAKQRRMAVVGHGVRSVGLEKAFAAGQSMVVHAEEFMYTELQRRTDGEGVPRVVELTRQSGAFVIPNLSAFDAIARQWGKPAVVEAFLQQPEAKSLPAYWVNAWKERDYVRRNGNIDAANAFLPKLTLALHKAGVPLVAGSDSPVIPGLFPGASLHEDMRLLVNAGLSPYDAIAAATRNAGEFAARHLRSKERFGLVKPGYRADLLLVRGNPLEDVARLKDADGIMVRGRWMSRADLNSLRDAASRSD